MDDYQTKLLEYIFATQVLYLANQLKAQSKAQGAPATGDFIEEAIKLVNAKSKRIFECMSILE
ncbi:MAG: hypothetical protein KKB20_12675 [Proteobacteria bacterium]|nr:hypothetical protein [Pseudomonadota bacterium]